MNFIPLLIKTDYSLLNSLIKIDDLIKYLKSSKINVGGICDNNLSGSIEFYKKCLKNDIKPIIGLEITYKDKIMYLYANSYIGYKNLLKINTLIELNEVDEVCLAKYSNDVILVLPYESNSLFDEFKFYNDIYISYKSNEEKINASLITSDIIFLNELKVFKEDDQKYLEHLNKMGGLNNLKDINYPVNLEKDDVLKLNNFIKKINIVFPENELHIPKFSEEYDSYAYLSKLANIGLEKRLDGKVSEVYKNRLNYELAIINKMGFVDYFLICYDYVLYAKKNDVLVGPGRGSAAGSLVSYVIGITDIDPIEYNLLFERFLNPNRVSMPDIDIDFDGEKRDVVINYVKDKYGEDKVAIGLTYNTLQARLVLREVGKILNIDNYLLDRFIKEINSFKTLKENLDNVKVGKYLTNYKELKKLYEISLKLEGLKKNISTHAAGVVISDKLLDEVIPIKYNNGVLTTGITMDYLEDLGLLKMDFLALKNLTIISNILDQVGKDALKNIDLEDKDVINLFKEAKTDGVFQYETYSMKELLLKLKPTNFNEIIAAVALVRPGPNIFLGDYIKNRDNPNNIKYDIPILESILKETYGVILYQEQIMEILKLVGDFSIGEADLVRRSISKKEEIKIKSAYDKFIKGALNKNIDKKLADDLFSKILRFSGYGFNKSHSVAYALIGYQMAYLKVHYKTCFYHEYLKEKKDKRVIEKTLLEMKKDGVKIVKPDINLSGETYKYEDDLITLPLNIIKGIYKVDTEEIIKNKPYKDYFEFLIKNKNLTKEKVFILAYAGALNSLELNVSTIIENYDIVKNYADLDGDLEKPLLGTKKEYSEKFLRDKEIELFGFYVGNHPSSKYQDKRYMKLININDYLFNNIEAIVVVDSIKKTKTKNNDDMAFIDISDETDSNTGLVFKEHIELLKDLNKNDLIYIRGKVSKSFDKVRIIINNIKRERVDNDE